MTKFPKDAINVASAEVRQMQYSFCTLVTQDDQYKDMVSSFQARGFDTPDCEFLYADNTSDNSYDGFSGLNALVNAAKGRIIILIHQDILAIDNRAQLDRVLQNLTAHDPTWAVAGNAGTTAELKPCRRMTSTMGYNETIGSLPASIETLDENLLILRADARIGFSNDLQGFHLYGTDLVQQAALRGCKSYVVDFHLEHLGLTEIDQSFINAFDDFEEKYRRALTHKLLRTTVTYLPLGQKFPKATRHRSRLLHQAQGTQPGFDLKAQRTRFNRAWYRRLDQKAGARYKLDGTTFQLPQNSPVDAIKSIRRGLYERPERELVKKWLPSNLPAIELGGSYGIVSHTIRKHLEPDQPLVVVEANPDLVPICQNNLNLAGKMTSKVVHAALAYGQDEVSFTITDGLHTSYVSGSGLDPKEHPGREIAVPAVTLKSLAESKGMDKGFSLICDIEGAEYDMFEHDKVGLQNCQCIILEIHPEPFILRGSSTSTFMTLVEDAGFKVVDQISNVLVLQKDKTS